VSRANGLQTEAARNGEILGLGVDIVDLHRFARFLQRHREALADIFTEAELTGAGVGGAKELYLATRWALKEAVFKALDTGWGDGVDWTDVEAAGVTFRPEIGLRGGASAAAQRKGATRVVGSTASVGDVVIASVALVG
jgi:holo-[acyl-carrier protein] synthase